MRLLRRFRNLTLQIEPTSACNLNCSICMRHNLDRPTSYLALEDFQKVLDSSGCRYAGIHGWGEPMLNKRLFEMIEYAESKGVLTNLTTNGTLLDKHMEEVFRSGLREIAFGIYERELASEIMPGIEGLVKERDRRVLSMPKVYLDITVYEGSLEQIPDLVRLAPEVGADAVILHRLFNAQKVDPSIRYISEDEERYLFADVSRLAGELDLELYLPPEHKLPCRIINRCIFVTFEGLITPCCFLPETTIGNALDREVASVMRSEAYAGFIRNMKQHPVCSKCKW